MEAASHAESPLVPALLGAIKTRCSKPEIGMLDRGYDNNFVYEACESKGLRPIISLRETPAVKAGNTSVPKCGHGTWTFAGSDAKRGASKWRCPAGECSPTSFG